VNGVSRPVTTGGAHWDGCWRAHLDCAIARVEELERGVHRAVSAIDKHRETGAATSLKRARTKLTEVIRAG
jgi:hypothetical protein